MTPAQLRGELNGLDNAVYAAIAKTRTPGLDEALGRDSQATGPADNGLSEIREDVGPNEKPDWRFCDDQ